MALRETREERMREKTEKEREEGKMEKDKQIQNQIHVRGMMDRRRRKLGKERNGRKNKSVTRSVL